MNKSTLDMCNEFNLHIKHWSSNDQALIKQVTKSPYDTHYIMRGGDILVSLNECAIELWIVNNSIKAKGIKAMLESDGLDLNDTSGCESSILETAMPKKNLEIYRKFLKPIGNKKPPTKAA